MTYDCGAWLGGFNRIACLLPEGHEGEHSAPWAEMDWTDEEAEEFQRQDSTSFTSRDELQAHD